MHLVAMWPRTSGSACVAAVTFYLASASPVLAQSSARYAWVEVPRPTSAIVCSVGPRGLNESGDVALNCDYKGGMRQQNVRQCIVEWLCYSYKRWVPWTYSLPAVWQSATGTVRALTVPARMSLWNAAVLNSGVVLATGAEMNTEGGTFGPSSAWRWTTEANVGEQVPVPGALSADAEAYAVADVTPGGLILWDSGGRKQAVQWPDGRVTSVPGIPDNGEAVQSEQGVIIHDQGMFVRTRWVYSATQATVQGATQFQAWYFNGAQWMKMTTPAGGKVSYSAVNARGQVLGYGGLGATYLWQASEPGAVTSLTGNGRGGPRLLNDAGLMVGALLTEGASVSSRATIWGQGGVALDLNTLTTSLPRGWVLKAVTAVNNKGQMVVSATDTTRTGTAAEKVLLLTPQ